MGLKRLNLLSKEFLKADADLRVAENCIDNVGLAVTLVLLGGMISNMVGGPNIFKQPDAQPTVSPQSAMPAQAIKTPPCPLQISIAPK